MQTVEFETTRHVIATYSPFHYVGRLTNERDVAEQRASVDRRRLPDPLSAHRSHHVGGSHRRGGRQVEHDAAGPAGATGNWG